ncbi:MAG TPA: hypothetical protein VLC71_05895 [Thermomonas sp.]|nr:hypothetical protein [Thermomonas sp.]
MSFDKAKLFSTKAQQERTITACGVTFPVYVRRLPAVDLRTFYAQVNHDDIRVRAEAGFEAMAKAIRNEDGSQFATVDEYRKMDSEAISALMGAFSEVNAAKKDDDQGNA